MFRSRMKVFLFSAATSISPANQPKCSIRGEVASGQRSAQQVSQESNFRDPSGQEFVRGLKALEKICLGMVTEHFVHSPEIRVRVRGKF